MMCEDPDELLERLRSKYLAVSCSIQDGTRAALRLGLGNRVMFVVASDGQEVVVRTTAGETYKLPRKELTIHRVYDREGKPVQHTIDGESGWLLVLQHAYQNEHGEEVEEWGECFPWRRYSAAHSEEVHKACRTSEKEECTGMLLSDSETIF